MKSDLVAKKMELFQWLSAIDDVSIIDKISDLIKNETKDWWESISDDEKKSIENGLIDASENKLNSHDKARSIYEKWL